MTNEVRVITADKSLNCEHLLGTFLDESHYDLLIDEQKKRKYGMHKQ